MFAILSCSISVSVIAVAGLAGDEDLRAGLVCLGKRDGLIQAQASATSNSPLKGSSFSVTVLSRGAGVPPRTLAALEEVRKFLAGYQNANAVRITEVRIGLEGERRLCAAFADAALANTAWQRVKTIIDRVDLVEIKEDACA